MPLLTLAIIIKCYSSMKHQRRNEQALITLLNKTDNEQIPVLYWENSIGRSKGSDIWLDDPTVSRDHAVLLRRESGWFISDTNSKSGVMVNGRTFTGKTPVYLDDTLTIGSTELVIKRADELEYGDEGKRNTVPNTAPVPKSFSLFLLTIVTLFFFFLQASLGGEKFSFQPLYVFAAYSAICTVFYMISTLIFKRRSFELETLAIFLTGIGLALLIRQEVRQTYVQMAAAAIGMVLFMFIIKFIENPDRIIKWRLFIIIGAVGLLGINLIFGSIRSGAQNWIELGPVTIQPSELVKVALIFVGAATLDILQTKRNLTEFIIFSGICIGSLFLMSDFGTALIFFMTFIIISFMRSGDIKTIILSLAAAVFGSTIILYFKPYVADRFAAWGHVWENYNDAAYQQARVLTYSASGGLFGVGLGNGYLKYVFASESDLVFGLMCEELGLIIAISIVLAIAWLVIYARSITTRSRSTFYSISACCAAGLLLVQSALNIFGATDILPLTGVTLPFISLGGSSMISCWGLLAFIKAADERTYKTVHIIKEQD